MAGMATTSRNHETVPEKADRLIREGRLVPLEDTAARWVGIVNGDTGTYAVEYVFGTEPTRKCQCHSHRRRGWCSHTLAILLQRARHAGIAA
jgi:hypothetical protein